MRFSTIVALMLAACVPIAWPNTEQEAAPSADASSELIVLNVGGERFTTSRSLLTNHPTNAMISAKLRFEETGILAREQFLDRDPEPFRYILSYLRSGRLHWSPNSPVPLSLIAQEAEYFCLFDLAQQALKMIHLTGERMSSSPPLRLVLDKKWVYPNRRDISSRTLQYSYEKGCVDLDDWVYPPQMTMEEWKSNVRRFRTSMEFHQRSALTTKIAELNADELPTGWAWRIFWIEENGDVFVQKVRHCGADSPVDLTPSAFLSPQ